LLIEPEQVGKLIADARVKAVTVRQRKSRRGCRERGPRREIKKSVLGWRQ